METAKAQRAHLMPRKPLSTNQTPHPTTKTGRGQQPLPPHSPQGEPRLGTSRRGVGARWACCLRTQQCVWWRPDTASHVPARSQVLFVAHQNPIHYRCRAHPTNRPDHRTPTRCGPGLSLVVLLRKEVIQPHLPVRLPCYDFVPIADPTFDGSSTRVRPPASGVTDFHDVTGGVQGPGTYSPQRC